MKIYHGCILTNMHVCVMSEVKKYKEFSTRNRRRKEEQVKNLVIFQGAKNELKNRQREDENHLIRPCAWDIARLRINRDYLRRKPSAAGRHLIR